MIRTLLAALALSSCADETISGYADRGSVYRLAEIDGDPFAAAATIAFPELGQASGDAPCNRWSAVQSSPYPWFELTAISVTRRACLALDEEGRFFEALGDMTLAEVSGDVLILSNETGREMVFRAQPR